MSVRFEFRLTVEELSALRRVLRADHIRLVGVGDHHIDEDGHRVECVRLISADGEIELFSKEDRSMERFDLFRVAVEAPGTTTGPLHELSQLLPSIANGSARDRAWLVSDIERVSGTLLSVAGEYELIRDRDILLLGVDGAGIQVTCDTLPGWLSVKRTHLSAALGSSTFAITSLL